MEYMTTFGIACGAVGSAVGALLTTWFRKSTEAKVAFKRAEAESQALVVRAEAEAEKLKAEARSLEKIAELQNEKECVDELKRDVETLKTAHADCVKAHSECEKSLSHFKGYVEGRFMEIAQAVSQVVSAKQIIPIGLDVIVQQKPEAALTPP